MSLRRDVLKLAHENPELRSDLLPLLTKRAKMEFPRVYIMVGAAGGFWLWTSVASFGRTHHVCTAVQQAEKRLNRVTDNLTAWLGEAGWPYNVWDVAHEPSKSKPRDMISSRQIRITSRGVRPGAILEDLAGVLRKLDIEGIKPMPQ